MSILDTASNIFKSIIGGGNFPTTYVTSTLDGKAYKVRDMPDKQQAADCRHTGGHRCDRNLLVRHFDTEDGHRVREGHGGAPV